MKYKTYGAAGVAMKFIDPVRVERPEFDPDQRVRRLPQWECPDCSRRWRASSLTPCGFCAARVLAQH